MPNKISAHTTSIVMVWTLALPWTCYPGITWVMIPSVGVACLCCLSVHLCSAMRFLLQLLQLSTPPLPSAPAVCPRPHPAPPPQVLIVSMLLLGCDEISNQLENPFRHLPLMDFIRSSTGDMEQ